MEITDFNVEKVVTVKVEDFKEYLNSESMDDFAFLESRETGEDFVVVSWCIEEDKLSLSVGHYEIVEDESIVKKQEILKELEGVKYDTLFLDIEAVD